jgi:hypothetical protein
MKVDYNPIKVETGENPGNETAEQEIETGVIKTRSHCFGFDFSFRKVDSVVNDLTNAQRIRIWDFPRLIPTNEIHNNLSSSENPTASSSGSLWISVSEVGGNEFAGD